MTTTETCAGCRFYHIIDHLDEDGTGTCRRYPPTGEYGMTRRFAFAVDDEWCGEWQGVKGKLCMYKDSRSPDTEDGPCVLGGENEDWCDIHKEYGYASPADCPHYR